MKKKIKVAILGGGPSNEREVSLRSAQQVFNNLPRDKYQPTLIDIKEDQRWFFEKGKPVRLYDVKYGYKKSDLHKFDLAFIALHGRFGEDGRIQAFLEMIGLPYTGSGVMASALAMDKAKASELVSLDNINTPKNVVLYDNFKNYKILKKVINFPCFVKPSQSGSSVGISKVDKYSELPKAIKKAFKEDSVVVVEEFIEGREITCGILAASNGGGEMVLPPVEIVPKHNFFDFEAKYDDELADEICPAPITAKQTKRVQDLAKRIHNLLGCDGLTRTDFILKDNKFYFLEINTVPGLTAESICPKEARAAGMLFNAFLDKQIQMAMKNKSFAKFS